MHYTMNNRIAKPLHIQMQMKKQHTLIYTVNIKKYYIKHAKHISFIQGIVMRYFLLTKAVMLWSSMMVQVLNSQLFSTNVCVLITHWNYGWCDLISSRSLLGSSAVLIFPLFKHWSENDSLWATFWVFSC